jgi:hypothetical protein
VALKRALPDLVVRTVAKGMGVHREVESEGRWRQILGPTNIKPHIGDAVRTLLSNKKSDLAEKVQKISENIKLLLNLEGIPDKVNRLEEENRELEYKLKIFEEKGLAEKLTKQTEFLERQREAGFDCGGGRTASRFIRGIRFG